MLDEIEIRMDEWIKYGLILIVLLSINVVFGLITHKIESFVISYELSWFIGWLSGILYMDIIADKN